MEKIIKVTGKGKLSLKPDTVIITMNLSNVLKDYEGAVKQSNQKVKELKDIFEKLGFKRSTLKTRYFNISTSYKSYKKGDDYYKRFEGYEYSETLVMEFALDNMLIAKALHAISNSKANPEFHIQFSYKDKEAAKNKLLALAVKDARNKAEVMAVAAGLRIKEVESIDYSFKDINFITREYAMCCDSIGSVNEVEMDPQDIDAGESVTVTFIAE